jgi:hypothetical protein
MLLVPYKRVFITSAFPVEKAVERISLAIEPKFSWFRDSQKAFHGSITAEGFRLLPVIRGRNTYLPVIHGRFEPGPNGTTTKLTFTLHPIAVAIFGVLLLLSVRDAVRSQALNGLAPVVGLAFFYILLYFTGFLPEVARAERILRDVLGDYE